MSDVNKLDELEALLAKAAQGEWTMHSEPEVGLPPMLFAADTSKIYGNLTPIEPLIYDDLAAIVAAVNWCRDEGITLARQSAEQAARVVELEGEIERLRESDRRKSAALQEASAWFLNYALQHDAKTPPDTAKAGTNYERAHYCDTAAFDDGLSATDYYFAEATPLIEARVRAEVAAKLPQIMQDEWGEICSDTGCHPEDIYRASPRDRKTWYTAGHWTRAIADAVRKSRP